MSTCPGKEALTGRAPCLVCTKAPVSNSYITAHRRGVLPSSILTACLTAWPHLHPAGPAKSKNLIHACLRVSPFVRDALNGVQQRFLVAVRVQLEFCPGVVAELRNRDLRGGGEALFVIPETSRSFTAPTGEIQPCHSPQLVLILPS